MGIDCAIAACGAVFDKGVVQMHISGEVKPAFEPVRELFQQSLSAARDKNAQLCIYVGEERVVDLWASSGSDYFSADTLVNVFSSGKSLESILINKLST